MSRKFALVIGNAAYDDPTLAQLQAPEEDMRALVALLQDPRVGGFDEILTLFNRPFAEVHPAIADFFADKKKSDVLLFYFSGHGLLDEQGRLYLALKNTRHNRLSGSAIQTLFLKDEMDRCLSRQQVLVLDCCHSGAFAQGAKGAAGAPAITNATFEGHGRFVLTATDKTQFAWEGDRIIGEVENSLFTHFLIEGLKTGAADIDGDGRITLDELYDYIYPRVVEATPKQKPRKIVYDQQGELALFKNPYPAETKPIELTLELRQAIENPLASVREAAVKELELVLKGSVPGLALSAHQALKHFVEDGSHRVANSASAVLATYEARKAQEATRRKEREEVDPSERERLSEEQARQEQLAQESATANREVQEVAKRKARAEAETKSVDRRFWLQWIGVYGMGIILLFLLFYTGGLNETNGNTWFISLGILGGIVGFLQWLVMRQYGFGLGWQWIAGNILIAGIVGENVASSGGGGIVWLSVFGLMLFIVGPILVGLERELRND